ncbi:hypothetical protein HYDPIDRAFT_111127 [Hydnomerulius pinastri MD-312]|uniref:Uncharacterized protein n=1 Tax=Hydnomerulius pinastri MD-312 TaxID=994086 RepID=A0A0C9VHU4_9AGAM|nr:hypothetical protein HYDPIDRAFT_111127 [Hydnomerulius pinastri MD-312]
MSTGFLSYRVFNFLFLFAIAFLIIVAFPFNRSLVHTLLVDHRYPPLYPKYHQQELELPHYTTYEHSDVKYLWAPNHPHRVGWGNLMQDYVLSYALAYASNRSFVFDDYTWVDDGSEFSYFNGKLIPSQVPLTALLSGPMVGGELPPNDPTPLAVSKDFFHRVCPNPTVLQVSDVSGWTDADTVEFIMDKWVQKITSIDDPCLQFADTKEQIVDVVAYGQKERLLSFWPYMSKLPLLTHWAWSHLILDAFEANREVIFPPAVPSSPVQGSKNNRTEPFPGLFAIHVRRGDFKDHCHVLAHWNADWNAFNSFLQLPDKLDRSKDPRTSAENKQLYMDHCYPTMEQIVEKVKQVRAGSEEPLKYLYIMTNGPASWVKELKNALRDLGGWEHIGSSRDLNLTWEQKYVAQALDMLVAQKAQVLIGNGWSSLTSNVVMLRMTEGQPPESNRFW